MSTEILPVPDVVLASEFPSLADRPAGTYNTKAKAWADSENAMSLRNHEIAVVTWNNAVVAREAANEAIDIAIPAAAAALGYRNEAETFRNSTEVIAAAVGAEAGLPALEGNAGAYLRVNPGESGVEFDRLDFATKEEAETGVSDAVVMSPLRVAQAIAATISEIGVDQTWQPVTRAIGVSYQNSTGKPLYVSAVARSTSPGNKTFTAEVSVDNVTWLEVGAASPPQGHSDSVSLIVPPGYFYRYSSVSSEWTVSYRELR